MQTTSRLGLTKWNLGSDPYNHLELAANWQAIDDAILKRTGDTATGTMLFSVSTTSTQAIGVKANADSASRFKVQPDGVYFGDGSGSYDIKLSRTAADNLKLEDRLEIDYSGGPSLLSSNAASLAVQGYKTTSQAFIENKLLSSDANPSLRILGSGEIKMGAGGASATDVRLYRSGAAEVTIVDNLKVTNLTASGTFTLNSVSLSISSGNFQTSGGFITSNIIRARDGVAGRVQLGNASDNTISAIYFGGSADVNLYRSTTDTLATDDNFVVSLKISSNSAASDSIKSLGGLSLVGGAAVGGNLAVTGTSAFTDDVTMAHELAVNGYAILTDHTTTGNLRIGPGSRLVIPSASHGNQWAWQSSGKSLFLFSEDYDQVTGFGANGVLRVTFSVVTTPPFNSTAETIIPANNALVFQQDSGRMLRLMHNAGYSYVHYGNNALIFSTLDNVPKLTIDQSGNAAFAGSISGTGLTLAAGLFANGGFNVNALSIVNAQLTVSNVVNFLPSDKAQFIVPVYAPAFVVSSDAALKNKPKQVNVLSKIASMETLGQWKYSKAGVAKSSINVADFSEPHFGPTAQEFNDLFKNQEHTDENGVHSINIADMAGVALLGVRALQEKVESLEKIIQQLGKQNG